MHRDTPLGAPQPSAFSWASAHQDCPLVLLDSFHYFQTFFAFLCFTRQRIPIVFQPALKTWYLQLVPGKRPLVWFEGFISLWVFSCSSLKLLDLGSGFPCLNYPVARKTLFSLKGWRKDDLEASQLSQGLWFLMGGRLLGGSYVLSQCKYN